MGCAPYGKVRKDIDGCRGEINGRTEMSRWDVFFEREGCGANYGLMLGVVGCALFYVAFAVPFGSGYSASSLQRALCRNLYYFVVVWRALIDAVFNGALPVML